MSWTEIKSAYLQSLDALKKNKLPLYLALLFALLQTTLNGIGAAQAAGPYPKTTVALSILSIPVMFAGIVWMQRIFDTVYGHTKTTDVMTILKGVVKVILIYLMIIGVGFVSVILISFIGGVFFVLLSTVPVFLFILAIAAFLTLVACVMYIMVRLSFFVSIAALEPLGPIKTLKESWRLTDNKFWKVLGFALFAAALGLAWYVLMGLVGVVSFATGMLSFASLPLVVLYVLGLAVLTAVTSGAQVSFFRHLQGKGKTTAAKKVAATKRKRK